MVLAAVAAALHRLLLRRGESVGQFVISVPFSARRQAHSGNLGNRSGVVLLPVRATGDPRQRLEDVAQTTRAAKQKPPSASNALLGPLFGLLVRTGLYRRVTDSQKMIHTFVSSMKGPEHDLSVSGWRVAGIIPLSAATGNVTVSFAAVSYTGTLAITLIADPDLCPDLNDLRDLLNTEIRTLAEACP